MNNKLVAIDSTDLETTTGGRAWDTTPTRAAVGQFSIFEGATVGTQPRPRSLSDALKTIYAPRPPTMFPQPREK
jgi:hypothetical protein